MEFLDRDNILKGKLFEYYNRDDNFNVLYGISINPKLSLRVVDWFVTNYSKKYNIEYNLSKSKQCKFNVYTSYKSQLKSYSKKYFDPFCRRERIEFTNQGKNIITTIGQLNFFKWAINNDILQYINNYYKKIDEDMNKSVHTQTVKRKKRKELSKSSYLGLNVNNNKVILYFD
mgnify:CR=1 FL=1|tara:strand:+ start:6609 stop:7127 length:519 start_codon:yes stop_codon:yes gene_type:complete